MISKALSVVAYIEEQLPERRPALRTLRALIRKVAPKADENMEYGMPSYFLNGPLCGFAAQKGNLALYICDVELVTKFKPRLGIKDCGKSCLRFKDLDGINLGAVEAMMKAAVRKHGRAARGSAKSPAASPARRTARS
jgi:uncharacterized protein YdhG (YjbR/CyaY superfamily)